MNRILIIAALLAVAVVSVSGEAAFAKGKNHDIKLPILKGPVHKPFDKDGYHFVCDNRGYCGNWNIGTKTW